MLGAVIAGYFTSSAANSQGEHERNNQAQGQLQAAAAKLITDSSEAGNMELNLSVTLATPGSATDDEILQLADKLYHQTDLVAADVTSISLLNSTESNSAAADLSAEHAQVASDIASIIADGDEPGSSAFSNLQGDMDKMSNAESSFVAAARAELA